MRGKEEGWVICVCCLVRKEGSKVVSEIWTVFFEVIGIFRSVLLKGYFF